MNTFRRPDSGRTLPGLAIIITLLVSMLAPATAMADAGEPAGVKAVIVNADGQNVKLREEPSFSAAEIARFAEGTTVEIVDGPVSGDAALWFEVKVEDDQGFMAAEFLKGKPEVPTTPPTTPTGPVSGRATATETVHVRSGPSTADSIVVTLQAGAEVTLTGAERDGWVSVSAAGGDGWVVRDFLSVAGTSPTPTPIPTETPVTPTPTATATPDGEVRYVLEPVHLRSGPGDTYDSLVLLPVGAQLFLTGEHDGLFAQVTSAFGDGWVYNQVIGPDNPNPTATVTPSATVTPTATTEPETPTPTETPGQTGTRYTLEPTHLRTAPNGDASAVVFMDSRVPLQLLGEEENGYLHVSTVFGDGWVLATATTETPPGTTPTPTTPPVTPTETATPDVTPTATAEPETPTPTETPGETVSRWTTENVNLRSESSASSTSLGLISAGTEVQFTGQSANGFSQVVTSLGTGWIASEFLSDTAPAPTPTPTAAPSGLLSWPVQGGEWRILQGYNGSSHQNRSSSWQYLYSLDLVRSDGNTAGQPVYAPADGVVRWIDEASGGGSIYLGNGQAFAWFHTIVDPSIQEGGTVRKGQLLGVLAPAGVAGAGSTPHLHISMWETDDEGNWSRRAVPFTGQYALSGVEFPSNGSSYQWTGFVFNP